MEYKITKKDYRGLLLRNFAPILILFVAAALLNVANGLTIDGDLTVIILEYIAAIMLIFAWIAQGVLILHLVNKEKVKQNGYQGWYQWVRPYRSHGVPCCGRELRE